MSFFFIQEYNRNLRSILVKTKFSSICRLTSVSPKYRDIINKLQNTKSNYHQLTAIAFARDSKSTCKTDPRKIKQEIYGSISFKHQIAFWHKYERTQQTYFPKSKNLNIFFNVLVCISSGSKSVSKLLCSWIYGNFKISSKSLYKRISQ